MQKLLSQAKTCFHPKFHSLFVFITNHSTYQNCYVKKCMKKSVQFSQMKMIATKSNFNPHFKHYFLKYISKGQRCGKKYRKTDSNTNNRKPKTASNETKLFLVVLQENTNEIYTTVHKNCTHTHTHTHIHKCAHTQTQKTIFGSYKSKVCTCHVLRYSSSPTSPLKGLCANTLAHKTIQSGAVNNQTDWQPSSQYHTKHKQRFTTVPTKIGQKQPGARR